MNKKVFLFAFLLLAAGFLSAEKKYGMYSVGFYNLENLFDTIHDEHKADYDFLPNGQYHWNKMRYENKLANMSKVLLEMGTDKLPGIGAAILGVSEVENYRVMDDLCGQPGMKERGYKYIHIEGPDKRGVDCALIYNPRFFQVEKSFLQPYVYEKPEDFDRATRGFLTVQGRLAGDPFTAIVVHLPSRGAVGYYRDLGARQIRALVDSIQAADPEQRIVVMGDMNDDPDNDSMAKYLRGRRKMKQVQEGDFFNPWWEVLRGQGQGTLSFEGAWNLFDQILFTRNLIDPKNRKDYTHLTLHSYQIFRRNYLMQQDGKYKGTPKRTTAAGAWQNGYSDHLPTVSYLIKEITD